MSASMPTPLDDEPLLPPPVASPRGSADTTASRALLGTSDVRRTLVDFVKRRVQPSDVDDVVQTVLCDALAAERIPSDASEVRRWLVGIARHKVADVHRKSKREPPAELPDLEASPAPIEEREMATWAERQAPPTEEARQTLDWMAREGEGEKLEAIASEEKVPAARVRQRVSRLRRWMKERWLAELAAVAAIAVLALAAWWALRRPDAAPDAVIVPEVPTANPEPPVVPAVPAVPDDSLSRAKVARDAALEHCKQSQWNECLRGLDDAKILDPAGENAPAVKSARDAAEKALAPPPEDVKKSRATPPIPSSTTPSVTPKSTKPSAPKASKKVLSSDDWDGKK